MHGYFSGTHERYLNQYVNLTDCFPGMVHNAIALLNDNVMDHHYIGFQNEIK